MKYVLDVYWDVSVDFDYDGLWRISFNFPPNSSFRGVLVSGWCQLSEGYLTQCEAEHNAKKILKEINNGR